MVVKEYQPLSIVKDVKFKKIVNLLNPGYALPSQKPLTTNLIPQEFQKVSENVMSALSQATAVAITTDSWTSTSCKKLHCSYLPFCSFRRTKNIHFGLFRV